MNIFMREMKAHRKSLIIWSFGIIAMIAAGMGKYVGMSSSGQTMNEVMESMPSAMKAIFGIGSLDLSKTSGFYGVLFLYLVLMATIHGAMMGANIISKEERDKTSEFLLVKPISRKKIITSKLLATLTNIVIFNLVTLFSSIFFVGKYGQGENMTEDLIVLMIGLFLLQLIFMSIGTAIAAINKKPQKATSLSTGVLLITFMLSVAIDMNNKLDLLKYFTPFKYFEAKNMMYGGGLEPTFVMISVGIVSVLSGATYYFYQRRDINV